MSFYFKILLFLILLFIFLNIPGRKNIYIKNGQKIKAKSVLGVNIREGKKIA
jgi:hypothetical protein